MKTPPRPPPSKKTNKQTEMGSRDNALFFLLLLGVLRTGSCRTREYFIGINEIQWDYAPSGKNLILNKTVQEDENAGTFLERGDTRIGSVYKKAVYQQYADGTYKLPIDKPKWLGFLGPVISAEEGDTVVIHLKNMASRPYTLHAHGLKYNKSDEGALYPDDTDKEDKHDDQVAPGKSHKYVWQLAQSHAPTKDDSNCLTRVYHSHYNAPKDIASGLIGPLIICKKDTLDVYGDKAADYLYALMFTVSDENLSWYLDDNIKTYCKTPAKVNKEDEDFEESNKMHSINGYVYGNLPGLTMCVGDKIHWHLFGMGNEVDIHSAFFHGQILTDRKHHVDTISLFPATFVNAVMEPSNPGRWLLSCQVNDHVGAGMQALFEVKDCFPKVHKPKPHGEVREYFIAAEEVVWDYGPLEVNKFTGKLLKSDKESQTFFETGNARIGGKYKKAVYVEYTDHTFTKRKDRTPEEEHLGILGPVIRAEEGDTIRVIFRNKATRPYSIQPHGVEYSIKQGGTLYDSIPEGPPTPPPASQVQPGSAFTYEWVVPKDGGPVEGDADCMTHLYYSAVDSVKDTSSGLVGPLLVCRPKTLKSGKQKNVKKEFHLLATVFDENLSWYLDDNIKQFTKSPKTVNKDDEDFQESNKMHSINGYMYGNLNGLSMCKGDKVSWHLSGLGSEVDIHGLYFHGNRFTISGTRRDSINLFPHISHTVIMEPDSMGEFEVDCRTVDHYKGGMRATYTVEKCHWWNTDAGIMLHQKTYYVAAVETEWDYSPNRTWEDSMHMGLKDSPGNAFIDKLDRFIGSKYKKVLYREFTDSSFTKQKERPADEEHLGILGPFIHADVGDKVNIVFKNMAKRPYSIHAHGVKTDSPQIFETPAGETHTYTWYVPNSAGPDEGQEQCIVGAYFSTVDVSKDLYSGLIGPLVICKRSFMGKIGLKKEIEEFALLFMVFDENESWYIDENIKTYVPNASKASKDNEEFVESNLMHAMNGRVYGNLRGLTMHVGDKVYWYLMGMGNEVDMHTVHFHGHSFDYKLSGVHRADVFDLFPATFQTVEMRPVYPGTWLLHCHVTDHIEAGMETTYTVLEKEGSKGVKGFLKGLFTKS
ncbi:ceruloplasmin isoform X2 [Anguilla anguilla]|uniref:ceruloplasmin isoform X2 n=1 Tax=Anguilla anguilla TaxID=7936 RepID=UPI0015B15D02|nr:ceruloplasmin isoform X2 [Anguilla anguilla]